MSRLALIPILLVAAAPSSAQFKGAWLPPEGTARLELSISRQENSAWFCGEGRAHCDLGERAVFSDLTRREESRTTSIYLKVQAAPWRFLSVAADLPYHDVTYRRYIRSLPDPIDALASSGIGDIRAAVTAGRTWGPWALSGAYGIQIPTGDFSVDAFIVPLGEGTLNHEVSLEGGRSLHPLPGYLEAGFLLRLRGTFTNEAGVEVHWGDERSWRFASGWTFTSAWWLQIKVQSTTSDRVRTSIPGEPPGDFRSSTEVLPSVYWKRSRISAEVWLKIPVAGRNTPADPTLGLSLGVVALGAPP